MWRRRLLFSLIFIVGTLIAVAGWLVEDRGLLNVGFIALGGHALQVLGALGHLLTPDRIEKAEREKNPGNLPDWL